MREELFHDNENVSKTEYEKLFLASAVEIEEHILEGFLSQLCQAVSGEMILDWKSFLTQRKFHKNYPAWQWFGK